MHGRARRPHGRHGEALDAGGTENRPVKTGGQAMPFGLFLLLGLSVLIYRWARRKGRSGLLWIVLMWVSCIGLGLATGYASMFWTIAHRDRNLHETELRQTIVVPTAVRMLVGAILPLVAVRRLR